MKSCVRVETVVTLVEVVKIVVNSRVADKYPSRARQPKLT